MFAPLRHNLVARCGILRVCLKDGLAIAAALLVVSAAALNGGTPPASATLDLAVAPASQPEIPPPLASIEPKVQPRQAERDPVRPVAVMPERGVEPAIGAKRVITRVETVAATDVLSGPKPTSKRSGLSERFAAIAAPESAFTAALRRAGADGYRNRFAKSGQLKVEIKPQERPNQGAERKSIETHKAARSTEGRLTVAEQIRRNSATMPSTLHLSDLLAKTVELAAVSEQTAASRASEPAS